MSDKFGNHFVGFPMRRLNYSNTGIFSGPVAQTLFCPIVLTFIVPFIFLVSLFRYYILLCLM